MQSLKAPGIDGLGVDFYKVFWNIVGQDLLDVLNESLHSGSLPLSCRRAVIALLPKKGNLQDIKNWRPVSLLCSDYKILSKALANRLREAMEHVIHRDQTYCVPGRSMVDNIHLIRDVLEVSSSLGTQVGLLSLDQEKAFDRVEHSFLWRTMERFGFSAGLIAMIKVLYRDIESVLKFNGGLCAPFRVHRGVRQGCALSGMLYALSLEPLLIKIRENVQGLVLSGFTGNLVLSAYADDVIVFTRDQQDINILNRITNKFSMVSAARVNWGKSEALAVGNWGGGLPVLPGGLTWKRNGIRYLGVYLGCQEIEAKNWDDIVEKVDSKLHKWSWIKPHMSFRGRVLVLNNLVASLLWHRLACLDPPSGLLAQVQSKMVDFFWDRLHWVPQSVLFLPREEGGQGLIHLASRVATFRLQFVQRWSFVQTDSLHWLLKEPLVCGGRLDVCSSATPGLKEALIRRRMVTLEQLVAAAGPELTDAQAVSSALGVRSVRLIQRSLGLWKQRLSTKEKGLLLLHGRGEAETDPTDDFPELHLHPDLLDLGGPLLDGCGSGSLHSMDRRILYANIVKTLNKDKLKNREVTVWKDRLGGQSPQWRALYKPPIKKRTGDLQWRILHGAIATSAFLSILNPNTLSNCPFCDFNESVFHVFTGCSRLVGLFRVLTDVFRLFNVMFTTAVFICGTRHKRAEKGKCQILNFLISEAKLAIYLTRRDKIKNGAACDAVALWKQNVRLRLNLEFCFYKATENLEAFKQQWGHDQVLVKVTEQGEMKAAAWLL
ncbi:Transposon TX1 uncharacterized 149 kDa protein ORF 2 [Takifugu flavidus]|uniref:Transposon TX1 uncharacterized 149 kDa protein ORF 2 n=1 Tax=Takifugu flavidus TaxID=433684 RepID=A0A5C6NJG5_9TELE|nr:Transposon TX1 uncharacterized 149 kDa protein ORF 2 [Takifugu flavidus]